MGDHPTVVYQPVATDIHMPQAQTGAALTAGSALDIIHNAKQLRIAQKIELLEVMCGIPKENKYHVFTEANQHVLTITESSTFCWRICWGAAREFSMSFNDVQTGQEMFHVERPFRFCVGNTCSDCCAGSTPVVDAFYPPGQQIASVVEQPYCCCSRSGWTIKENTSAGGVGGQDLFKIGGDSCINCRCKGICTDGLEFPVTDLTGQQVAMIHKDITGLLQECYSNASNFTIFFEKDMHPVRKLLLLAGTMLVDFRFFESASN